MRNRIVPIIFGIGIVVLIAAIFVAPLLFQPKELIIKISNPKTGETEGVIWLNNKRVQFDDLLKRMTKAPDQVKDILTIEAGRNVKHEQIVRIMDIAKKAGIKKIGFGIEKNQD